MTTQQKIIRRTSDVTLALVLVAAVVVAVGAAVAAFGFDFSSLKEQPRVDRLSCADNR